MQENISTVAEPRMDPSFLNKAGKASKLVYLNNSSRPLPNIMPFAVADIL
jgi:hypothetical protein